MGRILRPDYRDLTKALFEWALDPARSGDCGFVHEVTRQADNNTLPLVNVSWVKQATARVRNADHDKPYAIY